MACVMPIVRGHSPRDDEPMKAIRVQYTVKQEFVDTNRANIAAVMEELRAKGDVGVQYTAFLGPDGKTFTHVVVLRDEEASGVVPSLDAFKTFQAQLRQNVEVPPAAEDWAVVGSSYDL